MGRVDKLHSKKPVKRKTTDTKSMDQVLGKNVKNTKKIKKKKQKKKSVLNRVLVTVLILFVFITGGLMAYNFLNAGSKNIISFLPKTERFNNGEVTILMLGSDGMKDLDATRSDTILVCRFNFKEGYAHMISIPRDTMVDIPGHGKNKINAAYAYGGVELTKKTIEKFYGITIDKSMEVNFTTFRDAVAKLGGVEIYWDKEPLVYEPYALNIKTGLNHLDARTALYFVRFRKTATADLGRIGRQQLFLKSLAHDIKTKANIIQQVDIISSIYKGIKTDITLSDMMYMFNSYKDFDNFKITTWMSAGHMVDGVSYVVPEDNVGELARGFLDGNLVVKSDKEGTIFPSLVPLEEKAIADRDEAAIAAKENSK